LAVIQGARIAGAGMIIAVDVFEKKLAQARELGATHTVDASKGDPVKAIRELTNGGVEYAFEAIGLKKAAEQAFECIRPGGTATIIGMIPVGQKVELEGSMFLREKKMQGCSMGSNRFKVDMPKYVEFYLQGRLRLDEMITKRRRLEDVNDAFRAMKAGEGARTGRPHAAFRPSRIPGRRRDAARLSGRDVRLDLVWRRAAPRSRDRQGARRVRAGRATGRAHRRERIAAASRRVPPGLSGAR